MAVDVTEATFEQEVVERSRSVPVVVDFWADWCGPCKALGPVLEEAEAKRAGKVVLAKVDTDANQMLAQTFGIRGIPAVKAFKDAKLHSEFVGAQPAAAVERFFDALVPSEAELLAATDDEDSLRRALELEPGRRDAAVKLARILHDRGESDAALPLVDSLSGDFGAEALAARIRLERNASAGAPDGLGDALAALGDAVDESSLDAVIAQIAKAQDAETRDDLRRVVVGALDELGAEDPLAREMRRRLAAALY
jgi:putative thioredoxin